MLLGLPGLYAAQRGGMGQTIPMLNMKTKKPMKPMLEMPEIIEDAGPSRPNHPASAPTSTPNQPIQGQRAGSKNGRRIQRNDHAPSCRQSW